MADVSLPDALLDVRQWGPWTTCGDPDRDFTDSDRQTHHALLTNPELLTCFRRRFPRHARAGYDEMVRLLDYVWDCPHDGTANVTGHRCAHCGRTRAQAVASPGPDTDALTTPGACVARSAVSRSPSGSR